MRSHLVDRHNGSRMQFAWLGLFRGHAQRCFLLCHEMANSADSDAAQPSLKGDSCMLNPVIELATGRRGTYAG